MKHHDHGRHLAADDPEVTELDLIQHAARRLRRGAAVETAPWGLSPHQARALQALGGRPGGRHGARRGRQGDGPDGAPAGTRVSQLAERLQVTPRSATEVADSLESAGLVRRTPDPKDRRAVLLGLTQRGTEVADEIRQARRAASARAVGTMSAQDRAQLRRLLVLLLESLED